MLLNLEVLIVAFPLGVLADGVKKSEGDQHVKPSDEQMIA